MNCDHCRRRLLATADPGRPAAAVEAHLAGCPACRDWQRRILQLEANLPRLPVPPSRTREQVIRRVLSGAGPRRTTRPLWLQNWRPLAAGAAAAAVVIVAGFLIGKAIFPPGPVRTGAPLARRAPEDLLLARLVKCDLRLARAASVQERVKALAALADTLRKETRALTGAAATRDLEHLAGLYGKVIREGVVVRSEAIPGEERRKVLAPIADELARTGREAEQLAQSRPRSAGPLRRIATAAREGASRLRNLIGEGA